MGSNATIRGYTGSSATVSIPNSIEGYNVTAIGYSAFKDNTTIRSINLPNMITSVGDSAFQNCTALETVTMSYNSTVEYTASIGGSAFSSCTGLTSMGFSENVTSIGDYAFSGCTALSSLILPKSLNNMGARMIGNTAISSITIPRNVASSAYYYSSGYNGALANCKSLTEVIFEDGMKKIPDYICASGNYTSYITKVVIPESVTEIGYDAFYKCDNITIYGYKNSYAESYAITESIPFVSVAIAKNASADDVLKRMNLNTLINNVSFAGADISGPTVTIAGKTFSLFQSRHLWILNWVTKYRRKWMMKRKSSRF